MKGHRTSRRLRVPGAQQVAQIWMSNFDYNILHRPPLHSLRDLNGTKQIVQHYHLKTRLRLQANTTVCKL
ncbi:uncharacterized protein PHALS_04198 [Plasmopara halstedii]|uniref:Uncharacterized protein n=1 Tax=Plasmopara halstedii TaxID=4781 RepID=A0A0P1A8F9_PLAHL|nr:uncharacterized protein PHALS_04198 [Plasmopara halstedii]CEG36949.1 hypothetical protein PHALS_04198 [Plasmopara halstedii]|eukprot:XP_024573318.1 hypothetical protein PHALS_04198 [Plasmopara halstedii]